MNFMQKNFEIIKMVIKILVSFIFHLILSTAMSFNFVFFSLTIFLTINGNFLLDRRTTLQMPIRRLREIIYDVKYSKSPSAYAHW